MTPGVSSTTTTPAPSGRRLLLASAVPLLVLVGVLLAGRTTVEAPERIVSATERVNPGSAFRLLEELQSGYPGRAYGTDAHARAPDFLLEAFRAAGATDVRMETLDSGDPYVPEVRNVHARVPGVDRTAAVVLAAHYDTVPSAPGAIDDGGAVAVLVETARALSAGPPPACDVDFAVFDGEESGLLGSKAHVEALGDAGRGRVRAAIAVELVGWTEDDLVVHTIPYGFAWDAGGIAPAWLPTQVIAAARHAGVPVGAGDPIASPWYQGIVRVLGVLTGSDAGAYLERGVPACMLSGSALTNFYDAYHTPRDALDRVESDRLDDATHALVAATIELSELDAEDTPRQLGDAYILLGPSLIGRDALVLLSLTLLVPLIVAGRGSEARWVRGCLVAFGFVVISLAVLESVLGVVAGWPAALGFALSTLHPRAALARLVGLLPLLIGAALLVTAGLGFGFRWRADAPETVFLVALIVLALLCGAIVRARPARLC